MTNKLDAILDFIVLDDEQAPVLNEQGLPTLKQGPIVKDLAQLIAKGKVQHIERFAEIAAQGEQWQWARDYYDYLVELNRVNEYNANVPEPVANEDGSLTEVEPRPEPTAPERPALKTALEVLEPYAITIFKLRRQAEIDNAKVTTASGKCFDADETSITRLANALIKHWTLEPTDIIPWSTADVGTGVMVDCTKAEIIEAHQLATDNFAATWKIPN
ncbi:hypothetical protein [Pseudoalteromonas sp. KAN5]|uniref:hypothetical protein n=1 Tax=Pseudoalteromonas sp. KAN5 TaxID=2916633 RepID=UPI001FCBF5A2|nr:hypothetical protein [Pseudoalteromonas sp. KAN5]BDF94324.1 hypothetical protein KAN5_11620 [Pseudoalteromonas sp. KAN5]